MLFGYLFLGFILLTFYVFPIPCLVWFIYSIAKYVEGKKLYSSDGEEIKRRKKKMITAIVCFCFEVIFFSLDLIYFIEFMKMVPMPMAVINHENGELILY